MIQALISLRRVSRQYYSGETEVCALQDITLDIHAGEFVAIMGPSGSGKTTLLNVIGCLDRPSNGEYFYAGRPLHKGGSGVRARLRCDEFGFIFQNYNLLSMVTVQENVEMPAIYAGKSKRERHGRAKKLLADLGLRHRFNHHPARISGGEQQRVAIARALMNGGDVVLADEPTGSLDSRNSRDIMGHLKSLSSSGRTIVLVTHDPSIAKFAQRRIELSDGRIVDDSGASLRHRPAPVRPVRVRQSSVSVPVISLVESARTALRALRGNRVRTALTLLGIIVGVFSVIAMLGLAEGVRRGVLDTFRQLEGTGITIVPQIGEQSTPLTLDDAEAIRKLIPDLAYVAPEMSGVAVITVDDKLETARVKATTGAAMQGRGLVLAEGMFFSDTHNQAYMPVVILDGLLAESLFGQQAEYTGEYILLNGEPYLVTGVLRRDESRFAAFNLRGRSAHVPLKTGALRIFNRNKLDAIQIGTADIHQVNAAQRDIETLLEQRHGHSAFRVINQAEVIEAEENIAKMLSLLFGAIGSVSLLVAGIGVMNIMLASVAERTREIGVRMAIGAMQRDILMQFLCEAIIVSALGGLIGLLFAAMMASLVNNLGTTPVVFTPAILLTGLSCATVTGLLFGLVPAKRAAQMDPVEALAVR